MSVVKNLTFSVSKSIFEAKTQLDLPEFFFCKCISNLISKNALQIFCRKEVKMLSRHQHVFSIQIFLCISVNFWSIILPSIMPYFMFFLLHLLLSEITICNENFYVVNLIWYHKFTIIYIKIHTLTHKPQLLNINDHAVSSFYLQILSFNTTNIYVSCKQSKLKLYNNLSKNYKKYQRFIF